MYIQHLNLPKIPVDLEILITEEESFKNSPWLVHKKGVYKSSGHYQRCVVKPELEVWIQKNITNQYLHVSACKMYGEEHNAPHTDTTREFTLIYLTELGGKDPKTVFYQEHGQDLYRPRHYHPDYDKLEKLAEYTLEIRNWYLIDSRIIHSVEGIESTRCSIQVGFDLEHIWARSKFN